MKVKHWSRKLVVNKTDSFKSYKKDSIVRIDFPQVVPSPKVTLKQGQETPLKCRTPWKRGLYSISKVLHQKPKKLVKKAVSQTYVNHQYASPILLPLTIKSDDFPERYQHLRRRSHTVCDRAELRSILNERLRQKIFEKSMAAVIREAERELFMENNNNESVYVNFYREKRHDKSQRLSSDNVGFTKINECQEEDAYMTMSYKR